MQSGVAKKEKTGAEISQSKYLLTTKPGDFSPGVSLCVDSLSTRRLLATQLTLETGNHVLYG